MSEQMNRRLWSSEGSTYSTVEWNDYDGHHLYGILRDEDGTEREISADLDSITGYGIRDHVARCVMAVAGPQGYVNPWDEVPRAAAERVATA